MVVSKELVILFVPDAVIDEYEPVTIFYEKAAHGPGAKVVLISGIQFVPDDFWHHTIHGAAVQFEKLRIYRI
jgi:hypothetical protein